MTLSKALWAGGDIVTGMATVIEAMGAGRKAAGDIYEKLSGVKKRPRDHGLPEGAECVISGAEKN